MKEEKAEEILEVLWSLKTAKTKQSKKHFMEYGINMLCLQFQEERDARIVEIEEIVFDFYCTDLERVCSKEKFQEEVDARHMVWYLARSKYPKMSLKYLGELYNKDHSTVVHGINKVKDYIETDKKFYDNFRTIRMNLVLAENGFKN